MCGRYQFNLDNPEGFKERFQIEGKFPKEKIKTRYNIVPGWELPVVVSQSPNAIVLMMWGLIPFWEKSEKPHGLINVRDDTIQDKKWADKYIQFQRCLVPASGFYEWKKTKDGKVPYYIHLKNKKYFSFAGIYSEWKSLSDKIVKSFAIITTSPNRLMESIHHRMPVVLDEADEDAWLNPDNVEKEHLAKLLKPYSRSDMEAFPISTRINNPANDDPDLIKPT